MNTEEKTIKRNVVYEGKILTLRRDDAMLPDGAPCVREVVEHPGGVAVLAETERGILFVRQFRYPYGEEILELPAGKLERGEQPEACGGRELREETGYAAERLVPYGCYYPSPGYTDERLYVFRAEGLTYAGQQLDGGEFLNVEEIPRQKALELVASGEIRDAKTVIALLALTCGVFGAKKSLTSL